VEGTPGLAVVYGLCLQGLGISKIQTNLLPTEVSRAKRWSAKRSWFAVSAALLLLALGGKTYRDFTDRSTLADTAKLASAEAAATEAERLQTQLAAAKAGDTGSDQDLAKFNEMQTENDTMDRIFSAVSELVRQKMTQQSLYTTQGLEDLKKVERTKRKAIAITHLYVQESTDDTDIPAIEFGAGRREAPGMGGAGMMGGAPNPMVMGTPNPMVMGGGMPSPQVMGGGGGVPSPQIAGGPQMPGAPPPPVKAKPVKKPGAATGKSYLVYMEGVTPQPESTAIGFLNTDLINAFEEVCKSDIEVRAKKLIKHKEVGADNAAVKLPPDPLTGEDPSKDTRFIVGWVIALKDKSAPPAAGGGTGGAPGAAKASTPGLAGGAR
jgi:hypothetical protein